MFKIELEEAIIDKSEEDEQKHSLRYFEIDLALGCATRQRLGIREWKRHAGKEKKEREDGIVVGETVPLCVLHSLCQKRICTTRK